MKGLEDMKKESATELMKILERRLQWYILEAKEEEFDVEEIDFIIKILQVVEPVEVEFEDTGTAYRKLMKRIKKEPDAREGDIWIGSD